MDQEKYWQIVPNIKEKASSRVHENTAQNLFDLSQAYQLNQATDDFQLRLTEFMQPYLRKRAFIGRLDILGLSFTCQKAKR